MNDIEHLLDSVDHEVSEAIWSNAANAVKRGAGAVKGGVQRAMNSDFARETGRRFATGAMAALPNSVGGHEARGQQAITQVGDKLWDGWRRFRTSLSDPQNPTHDDFVKFFQMVGFPGPFIQNVMQRAPFDPEPEQPAAAPPPGATPWKPKHMQRVQPGGRLAAGPQNTPAAPANPAQGAYQQQQGRQRAQVTRGGTATQDLANAGREKSGQRRQLRALNRQHNFSKTEMDKYKDMVDRHGDRFLNLLKKHLAAGTRPRLP